MNRLLRLLLTPCALAVCACSGQGFGPAPEISELAFESVVPSDTTHIVGTVHVSDPAGLSALTVNVTIIGPRSTVALPPTPILSTVEGQTEAMVEFKVKDKRAFGGGTYAIAVTLTEEGTPSNELTAPMVVE
jgi:hypothetical protein